MNSGQTVYFVGDVHLDARIPAREKAFCRFLDYVLGEKPDALYLMGDIFEFWFGYRTVMFAETIRVVSKLAAISEGGTRITYITGNHDFNPGPVFSRYLGFDIATGPVFLDLGTQRVYVSHGDEINTEDRGYRFLKSILRNGTMQMLFRIIPASWAYYIGRFVSDVSRKHTQKITDIPPHVYAAFSDRIAESGFDVVIHGHTHKPEMKTLDVSGKQLLMINSGHWFGPGYYVVYENGKFRLNEFEVS
ncbi:UDP-2,3-diacylglucosamine diphosphatase [bacterium]|nr:UDP-2,3-diacylglucosamine diphosphatase [candidate division CSSED10-310 bacterium]